MLLWPHWPVSPSGALLLGFLFSTFSAFGQVLFAVKLGNTHVSHGDGAGARGRHGSPLGLPKPPVKLSADFGASVELLHRL